MSLFLLFLNLDFCKITDVSALFLQTMSISFWITKRKFPKLRLTVGRKGRCPLFWSFFGSNILWMTSPSFCERCTSVYFSQDCTEERFLAVFFFYFPSCLPGTNWLATSTTYSCVRISWRTGCTVTRRQACIWLLLLFRLNLGTIFQR